MKKYLGLLAFLAVLCVSCKAAGPVPGLSLSPAGGGEVPVFADEPETAASLSASARTSGFYSFASAVPADDSRDLVLDVEADGKFLVKVYGPASAKMAAASFSVDMRGSGLLHLPLGGTVESLEIVLDGAQNLVLCGLSVDARLTGLRLFPASAPRLHQSADAVLSYKADGSIAGVALPLPTGPAGIPHASVVAEARETGKISFASGTSAWEISSLAGMSAALPLESLGGRSQAGEKVEVSAAGGLIQAFYDYGDGAPPADLHALLSCSAPAGDFSLWSWDILRDTLVFDFKDYAIQDLYLKRLAFFAEKPGFVGRLAGDSEIASLHGWNAHDYPASTLHAFYSLAKKNGFALNKQELELYTVLLRHSILREESDGGISPGSGALISICHESDRNLRRLFIDHESSHALFFQDAQYRELAARLWDSQGPELRSFWKLHFEYRRYDPSNRYLMVNELQAYLVQQSTGRVSAYYKDNVIPRLAAAYPARAGWLAANSEAFCLDALAQAKKLDAYLAKTWLLRAGAFGRAVRLR